MSATVKPYSGANHDLLLCCWVYRSNLLRPGPLMLRKSLFSCWSLLRGFSLRQRTYTGYSFSPFYPFLPSIGIIHYHSRPSIRWSVSFISYFYGIYFFFYVIILSLLQLSSISNVILLSFYPIHLTFYGINLSVYAIYLSFYTIHLSFNAFHLSFYSTQLSFYSTQLSFYSTQLSFYATQLSFYAIHLSIYPFMPFIYLFMLFIYPFFNHLCHQFIL